MTSHSAAPEVVTLTLNPAIDRTVTIPGFAAGSVNRVTHSEDRAGGKGINVAVSLAKHGHRVAALGFLGRDNVDVFAEVFAARGVEDRCIRLPGETRVGIKIVDPVSGQTTDINFPGLAPSASDLAALREQMAALSGGWCVLAGSLPPGVEPGIYREIIASLKARGVSTLLDTSGEALREGLKAAPDIIKPNVHELETFLGERLSTEKAIIAAARKLVTGGMQLVVVSRGAEGACFVTAEEALSAVPPAVEVRSTVGAGDAMVAGIVAAQLRGLSLLESARLATAFSLAALTRGSSKEFLDRVQVAHI